MPTPPDPLPKKPKAAAGARRQGINPLVEIDPRLYDFRNFLWLTWQHLGLPEPTPVQYDLADYLQNGPRRCVIQAFRGVGKSFVTSAFVIHQLLLDPAKNILVVSSSKQRADDFTTFTLRIIESMPLLEHLRPRDDQRKSKLAFDVGLAPPSQSPSVVSKGITSQITGSRADLIVADDVESANNSLTQTMRDKLGEAVKEFDAVLKPDGRVVYLGTPQTEASLYAALPERGYETRIWPARFPEPKLREFYGLKLAPLIADQLDKDPMLPGRPTDPRRFSDLDLMEREMSFGRSGFALQFMLDTSLSDLDRYPLRLSDAIITECEPDVTPEKLVWGKDRPCEDLPCVGLNGDRWYRAVSVIEKDRPKPYHGSVMAIDPSGRGVDETAYAVVKMLNGFLFVTEAGGLPGGYDERTLKELVQIAARQKVNHIVVESNFGDGMFTELLKPHLRAGHNCFIEEVRHSVQKEKRIIDTLEPVLNQHRLVIDSRVVQRDYETAKTSDKSLHYSLFYQMSRIVRARGALLHDDRLDALAIAVNYWTEQMAQDADEKIGQAREQAIAERLERFMEGRIIPKEREEPQGYRWNSMGRPD